MPLEQTTVAGETTGTPGPAYSFVTGSSPAMRSVERLIADIGPTNIPVIVGGESGSGKDFVAQEFHRRSSRQFFLKCNCGSVAAGPLMDRLCSAKANSSPTEASTTFFLDEVDQLDSLSQNCLLQFFAENDRMPARSAGLRVISATALNLEQQMRTGRFDQKLYYRLNGVYLRLPPLRDREEDIGTLFTFFLGHYASVFDLPIPELKPAMAAALLQYEWPGNVRELENLAREAVVLQDLPHTLNESLRRQSGHGERNAHALGEGTLGKEASLKEVAREASRRVERALILKTLEQTHWNRKRAARHLQISYKALLYKLKQLGLDGSNDSSILAREAS